MKYETVIGLEIHTQLLTESKMFCSCSTRFGAEPNTHICPICTGQPGVLPVTNKKAVELAIKTALALNCRIEPRSVFARKHYFYPDLPKNFQISQYELPLATGGYIEIEVDGKAKKIGITRVHLEEDAGKLVHIGAERIMGAEESLVDYNRTGTPLMEIVSEPDLRSPKEAAIYMQSLARLLQHIGVSDAKMEEGSLRCDANLSVRPLGEVKLGVKTEVKNMNSFKAVEKALSAEEKRHLATLAEGGKIIQETRFFDDITGMTAGMRGKEYAHDYRYFPEPDLIAIEKDEEWVEEIRSSLPEDLNIKIKRYKDEYKLNHSEIELITSDPGLLSFFEEANQLYPGPKTNIDYIARAILFRGEANAERITPSVIAEISKETDAGRLSRTLGLIILGEVVKSGRQIKDIIAESGMTQISDQNELENIISEVLKNHPKQAEEYRKGKETVLTFLVGQVMKASKGRANPALANQLLRKFLA